MKDKKETYWRRLDNSAKIFPISVIKKYSPVFRLSAILKENVKPEKLKIAVENTLEKYESFKVRMKKGVFWYYFEHNEKEPIVTEEKEYPCKYINPRTNNNYQFKITYFKNKINMDTFHSLADGNSASIFFREIIYTYLELVHPDEFDENERTIRKVEEVSTEDSYILNYDKKAKSNASSKKAYLLKGKKIDLGAVSVIHQIINFEQLKKKCEEKQVTVTQYLSAVLINSVYIQNYVLNKGRKPIKICIPVNLRKYYQSKTMSNFFSYITLEAYEKDMKSFDVILEFVKREFKNKLTPIEINKTMSTNVKIGTNPFVKIIPLFLKKWLVQLGYIEIRKYTTMTYSNIGRIGIIGKYQKYLDYFVMLIAPDSIEKIKCSSCTLENNLVFTFTSLLKDNKIEKAFYNFLKDEGIEVKIESNGVLDDIS